MRATAGRRGDAAASVRSGAAPGDTGGTGRRWAGLVGTGVRLLPLMATYVVVGAVAAPLVRRAGFRTTVTAGSLLVAAGALAMTAQDPATPYATTGALMAVFGAGAGLVLPPSTAAAVISVPHRDGGMASGTVNLFR